MQYNGVVLLYSTYSEIRTVNPTTPYPSSTLYNYAIKQGLLLVKWGAVQLRSPEKFYEKRYLNTGLIAVIFMEISDEMAYKLLYEANKELLKNHYDHLCNKLYLEQNVNFRGFRL